MYISILLFIVRLVMVELIFKELLFKAFSKTRYFKRLRRYVNQKLGNRPTELPPPDKPKEVVEKES